MTEMILFIVFGLIAISGAIGVIVFRSPVHSALSLVLTFFAQAGLFIALGAHFVAAVQIIVYAGAIMVLFLFVIMLLNLGSFQAKIREQIRGIKVFAVALAILLLIEASAIVIQVDRAEAKKSPSEVIQKLRSDYDLADDELQKITVDRFGSGVTLASLNSDQASELLRSEIGKVERIGAILFSDYVLPFEITSFILFAALIGVITIVKEEKTG